MQVPQSGTCKCVSLGIGRRQGLCPSSSMGRSDVPLTLTYPSVGGPISRRQGRLVSVGKVGFVSVADLERGGWTCGCWQGDISGSTRWSGWFGRPCAETSASQGRGGSGRGSGCGSSGKRAAACLGHREGLVEQLLPTVPAELREEALRRAMNGLGNELFVGTGLAAVGGSGEAGELM